MPFRVNVAAYNLIILLIEMGLLFVADFHNAATIIELDFGKHVFLFAVCVLRGDN